MVVSILLVAGVAAWRQSIAQGMSRAQAEA